MANIPHTEEITIILPESLIAKIEDFQEYVSNTYHLKWELSEIMILLLKYIMKDFDKISYDHFDIVKSYFVEKQDLLDDIYLNTIRSSHIARRLCTV